MHINYNSFYARHIYMRRYYTHTHHIADRNRTKVMFCTDKSCVSKWNLFPSESLRCSLSSLTLSLALYPTTDTTWHSHTHICAIIFKGFSKQSNVLMRERGQFFRLAGQKPNSLTRQRHTFFFWNKLYEYYMYITYIHFGENYSWLKSHAANSAASYARIKVIL